MSETPTYSLPSLADLSRETAEPHGYSTHSNHPNAVASQRMLKEAAYILGVRPYHLGQLLGTSSPTQIYHWTAGRKRPCALYMTRLLQLVVLKVVHGWNFVDVRLIDWETREVFPRKESCDSYKDPVPVGEWTFSKPVGPG